MLRAEEEGRSVGRRRKDVEEGGRRKDEEKEEGGRTEEEGGRGGGLGRGRGSGRKGVGVVDDGRRRPSCVGRQPGPRRGWKGGR